MKAKLYIVSQCTDRKRAKVPSELQLRHFRHEDVAQRAMAWVHAHAAHPAKTPVHELYAGEHWVYTLGAVEAARAQGFDAELWVASAGCGLARSDERVACYSATFTSNVADSVIQNASTIADQRRRWWREIRERRQYGRTSLPELASTRGARVLVVASPPYLQAIAPELLEARSELAESDHLVVVSSRLDGGADDLASNWIESSARVQSVVGGTRIGQNARVALTLLRSSTPSEFGAGRWREVLTRALNGVPEYVPPDREPMSDDDVRAFVSSCTASSWSRALRELRGSGRACEQKRFKQLFLEARSS